MTIRYRFGCDLSYEVKVPTFFVFNVEAARIGNHHDLQEKIVISPDYERRTHIVTWRSMPSPAR